MSPGNTARGGVQVAVVADRSAAARQIGSTLRESGYLVRQLAPASPAWTERLRGLRPSAVVFRTATCEPPESAAVARLAGADSLPVVLLTPTASSEALGLAADSGALMHLVEPVTSQVLTAAVRLAVARAQDRRAASGRLATLRESVAAREALERAKTILMRRFGFTEEQAHRRLQMESRSRNRRLAETAWHVIQADAQLGRVRKRVARPR